MAKAYRLQEKFDFAKEEYKKAQGLGYDNGEIYRELGDVHLEMGEYESSIVSFKKVTEVKPNDEDAHEKLATLYQKQGEYELAIKEFNKILEINPSSECALQELGKVYQKQRNLNLGIEKIIKYTELDSENDVKDNRNLMNLFRISDKKGLEKEDLSVKIIRIPFFRIPEGGLDYSLLLPLGMAQIVSYLRSNGIKIDQDDLNIKIHYDNRFGDKEKKVDEEIFYDEKRIIEYSNGKEDPYIDSIMEKVEEKSKLDGYKVILLSVPDERENSSVLMFVLSFAKYIKKKYKPIIMGGGFHASFYSIIKCNNKNIDFIIKGAGEKPLFKLLLALNNKVDIKKIPNLVVSTDGKLIEDGKIVWDIKPDFTGLPIEMYRYKNLWKLDNSDEGVRKILDEINNSKVLIATFRLIEGCPYDCIYCNLSKGNILRILSLEKSIHYLKKLKEEYNITGFFFLNNTVNISKKYINDFCDKMIKSRLNILWCDSARPDNLDRDTLFKLREAGCIRLIYGMETGCPTLLKYINKQISLKRLEDIIRWTDEAGIWVGLDTICCLPYERKKDLEMTVDFIKRNKKYINTVFYNLFQLRAGSKLYLNPEKYGIKNISEVNYCKHPRRDILSLVRHGYDEIDGLKWEDKLKQMIEYYDYFFNETKIKGSSFPTYEVEPFLFFLYSKFKDKRDIVRIFNKVSECIQIEKNKKNEFLI